MSVSREIGPGEHLWLIDAVYRLDGLAPPPPPAASDSTAAVSRLVGPFRACAAALGRADTVRALALYEPMVDAVRRIRPEPGRGLVRRHGRPRRIDPRRRRTQA